MVSCGNYPWIKEGAMKDEQTDCRIIARSIWTVFHYPPAGQNGAGKQRIRVQMVREQRTAV